MRFVVFLALCALCFELTNSRTSTFWKLNTESGKITTGGHVRSGEGRKSASEDAPAMLSAEEEPSGVPLSFDFDASADVYAHDEVFYIIASTLSEGSTGWVRQSPENSLESLMSMKPENGATTKNGSDASTDDNGSGKKLSMASTRTGSGGMDGVTAAALVSDANETLDCGKPVNFTYYDYLIGVGQRFNHPLIPEPEVAYLFLKTKDENTYKNFDINALERRLKRAKREKPRSVQLYNQIGNYWRIVGDACQAIECFRRALAMSPTNAEVLLNLARVLYNLQYLDDAIHLTRRSLEMQPPGRSAWQQYFTLGEIFKAYGHFQESILHLRHALELYPHHEPILKALRDVENSPSSTLHVYTVVIIVTLVVAVFIVIITSSSNSERCNAANAGGTLSNGNSTAQFEYEPRTRHFNRAMAMRSLKGLSSTSRNFRHKKN